MKFNENIKVYGNKSFRGDCPCEEAEQIAFFSHLRAKYPKLAKVAMHPKNEQKIKGAGFSRLQKDKALGFCKSAADIIILGGKPFVCELKRQDHTKSKWQEGQQEFLEIAGEFGCFACVALGAAGAIKAFEEWLKDGR